MRSYRFKILVVTASALNDLRPEEAVVVSSRLTDAVLDLNVLVLGEASEPLPAGVHRGKGRDPARVLRDFQHRSGHTPEETVVVGCESVDLRLAEDCAFYFHVGAEAVLEGSVRRLVPLWGQYGAGVANVLEYLHEHGFREVAIKNRDIVDFVGRSISFYDSRDAVTKARRAHDAFCRDLGSALEDEVAGIFGTGFPFYCRKPTPGEDEARTPASIGAYLREQEAYFASKLLDEETFRGCVDTVFDAEDAEAQLGLRFGRNQFDLYEYESSGVSPPDSPSSGTLRELHARTTFDLRDDPWPCLHCVSLQAPDLRPRQRLAKDTNETCLRCRQTSLMLRNVSGCAVDLDVVVVVREDAPAAAERVKGHIVELGTHYLYDLDLRRMVGGEGGGPVDLFVTTTDDLLAAFEQLATPRWLQAGFPAVALWSLTLTDHHFNLGEDFLVGFEPQIPLDPELERELIRARRAFAEANSIEAVLTRLRTHSSARRQLLGNPEVIESLGDRLADWRSPQAASAG